MNKITHPIEPEELMAYLDGELSAERAAAAAAHLGECEECKKVVAELRGVSQTLHSWEVGDSELPMSTSVTRALEERGTQHQTSDPYAWRKSRYLRWPRIAWAMGLATVGVLMIISVSVPLHRSREAADRARSVQFDRFEQFAKLQKSPPESGSLSAVKPRATVSLLAPEEREAKGGGGGGGDAARLTSGPMIIRTAELKLITKDFDKARAALESILKRHRGYVGELKVGGATGSARTLTATPE